MRSIFTCIICLFSFVAFGRYETVDTSRIPLPGQGISHPIRFLTLSAVRVDEHINIHFSTPSESITSIYYLERSENGHDWEIITTIPTLNNLNAINKYNYTDRNISLKRVYYRIKQAYLNGMYSYSPIVYAKQKSLDETIRISGMANNNLALFFPNKIKTNVHVQVQTMNGQILMVNTLTKPEGHIILQVPLKVKGMASVLLTDGELLHVSGIIYLL